MSVLNDKQLHERGKILDEWDELLIKTKPWLIFREQRAEHIANELEKDPIKLRIINALSAMK